MASEETINNILKALYQESSTIKIYVDAVAQGNPIPYTILVKSNEVEEWEKIVKRLDKKIKEIADTLDRIEKPTVVEGQAIAKLMEELAILRTIRG